MAETNTLNATLENAVQRELESRPSEVKQFAPPKLRASPSLQTIYEELHQLKERHKREEDEVLLRLKDKVDDTRRSVG